MNTAFKAAVQSMPMGVTSVAAKKVDRGAIDQNVMRAIRSQEEILRLRLPDALLKVVVAGARTEARGLKEPGISFDTTNSAAQLWASQHAGEMIVGASAEMKAAVRDAMTAAFADQGLPPAQSARLIRESVGLTKGQTNALNNLRTKLIENPGKRVKAGKVPIRVPKTGITADRLDRALESYSTRLRNARALTIARTETIAAANEGQRLLWAQAVADGLLSPGVRRVWIAANNPCPICQGLNGTTVGLQEPFAPGLYGPPAHPRCRCSQGLAPSAQRKIA